MSALARTPPPCCPSGHTLNYEKSDVFCTKECGRLNLKNTPSLLSAMENFLSPSSGVFYGQPQVEVDKKWKRKVNTGGLRIGNGGWGTTLKQAIIITGCPIKYNCGQRGFTYCGQGGSSNADVSTFRCKIFRKMWCVRVERWGSVDVLRTKRGRVIFATLCRCLLTTAS